MLRRMLFSDVSSGLQDFPSSFEFPHGQILRTVDMRLILLTVEKPLPPFRESPHYMDLYVT